MKLQGDSASLTSRVTLRRLHENALIRGKRFAPLVIFDLPGVFLSSEGFDMGVQREHDTWGGWLRQKMFGISDEETTFRKRGFEPTDPQTQQRLEQVGRTFVEGYHLALQTPAADPLAARLDVVESERRGFAYEGAAMGLALLDALTPLGGQRWCRLLDGPGDDHAYMMHVGYGWAAARVPWLRRRLAARIERLDPLLRWLVFDGYGFHQAYFDSQRHVREQAWPAGLTGYARHAFDQGLGRCLWFVEGAEVARIKKTVDRFPPARHDDLYGGLGLAATYAGGVPTEAIEQLRNAAGPLQTSLGQGAAFAAKARQRAGNPTDHCERACQILCGMSAQAAAEVTDVCREDLPYEDAKPAYEHWRRRIQAKLAEQFIPAGSR